MIGKLASTLGMLAPGGGGRLGNLAMAMVCVCVRGLVVADVHAGGTPCRFIRWKFLGYCPFVHYCTVL